MLMAAGGLVAVVAGAGGDGSTTVEEVAGTTQPPATVRSPFPTESPTGADSESDDPTATTATTDPTTTETSPPQTASGAPLRPTLGQPGSPVPRGDPPRIVEEPNILIDDNPPWRAPPTVTLDAAAFGVEAIYQSPTLYFRRTDNVGSFATGRPDAYGSAGEATWGGTAGAACLLSEGGEYTFEDTGTHVFVYGLVGSDIVAVDIVLADGSVVPATISSRVHADGMRAWLAERPSGPIARIDGFDAGGSVVSTIVGADAGVGTGC
jgi:hypothetical protein